MLPTLGADLHPVIVGHLHIYKALRLAATCKTLRAVVMPLIADSPALLYKTVACSVADHFLARLLEKYPTCETNASMTALYWWENGDIVSDPTIFTHEIDVFAADARLLLAVHYRIDIGIIELGVFVDRDLNAIQFFPRNWLVFRPTKLLTGTVEAAGHTRPYANGVAEAVWEGVAV
jgi:hypothetical protein